MSNQSWIDQFGRICQMAEWLKFILTLGYAYKETDPVPWHVHQIPMESQLIEVRPTTSSRIMAAYITTEEDCPNDWSLEDFAHLVDALRWRVPLRRGAGGEAAPTGSRRRDSDLPGPTGISMSEPQCLGGSGESVVKRPVSDTSQTGSKVRRPGPLGSGVQDPLDRGGLWVHGAVSGAPKGCAGGTIME